LQLVAEQVAEGGRGVISLLELPNLQDVLGVGRR
jgi:hypothetical protein